MRLVVGFTATPMGGSGDSLVGLYKGMVAITALVAPSMTETLRPKKSPT